MDYFKIYERLIDRARSRNIDDYYERHHVIPRCMGGNDDPNNIVNLTPEEHYLAHQLLVKMYPSNAGLVSAASYMCTRPNNKMYGWLKRKRAEVMTVDNPNKGGHARRNYNAKHGSPNKGHKHSDNTKQLLSEQKKGQLNPNKDGRARLTHTYLVDELTGKVHCYESLKAAEKNIGANHASVYNNRKANRPYMGYYWFVGDEYDAYKLNGGA